MARTHDSSVRAYCSVRLGPGDRPLGWWSRGGDGEFAQELAGGGVDDADVQVLHEQQDARSGVGSADAEVVQAPGQTQGDATGLVDLVGADAVGGTRGTAGGGGGPVRQGPVRAVVVAGGDEDVEQSLQLVDGGRLVGSGGHPVLQRLVEAFDLAAGGGVAGPGVLLHHVGPAQFVLEGGAAAGEAGGGPCRCRSAWPPGDRAAQRPAGEHGARSGR